MAKVKDISLHPPLGGLNEQLGYEYEAPYTSPDLNNVRPFDTDQERTRIGQRPGLVRACATQIADGYAIVGMCQIITTYVDPEA